VAINQEQIAPDSYDRGRKARKLRKKRTVHVERRAAKKDPVNAPKKRRYWGYEL